jgi:RNA polymerase sigma-70 factor (ECF subfamily)
VTERLLKALREARPRAVRRFFALASHHIRWELNNLARRLVITTDERGSMVRAAHRARPAGVWQRFATKWAIVFTIPSQ